MNKWIFSILFCLHALVSNTQRYPSVQLPEITVIDSTNRPFFVSPVISLSTTKAVASHHSISSVLEESSHAHIRSYGPGRLSTISMKGASPQQTPIIYQGFNLQNPTLGLTDLSIYSGFLFDQVSIGSSPGTMFGSGVFNNAVHLSNEGSKTHTIQYQSRIGSLNQMFHGMSFQRNGTKFTSIFKGYIDSGKNQFEYTGRGGEVKRLNHARHRQFGFFTSHTHQINVQTALHFFATHLDAYRDIPPTRFQARSESTEIDYSSKIGLVITKGIKNGILTFRSAWMDDKVNYSDPLIPINSKNHGQSLQSAVRLSQRFGPTSEGMIQAEWTHQKGKSSNHIQLASRNQYAFVAALKKKIVHQRGTVGLSARFQSDEFAGNELLPHFELQLNLTPSTSIFYQIQRTFRLPSLDDLFWSPGGNPGLKPESGWHYELGTQCLTGTQTLTSKWKASGYFRSINNWILWRPVDNYIWSPENIASVKSRGIELSYDITYRRRNHSIQAILFYTLQDAIEKHHNSSFQNRDGNQLIYMPRHQLKLNIFYKADLWQIGMHHRMVSKSYSDPLNERVVPKYQIGTFSIQKTWLLKTNEIQTGLKMDNIWDEDYEVISNYPMPGRTIHFTFKLNI